MFFGETHSTKLRSGLKNTTTRTVPNMLNNTWTRAALFASAVVPAAAMIASIVEPMLLPYVMMALISHVTTLLKARVITMAVKALEECIKAVMKIPMRNPTI